MEIAERRMQIAEYRVQSAEYRLQNAEYTARQQREDRGAGSGEWPMNSATAGPAGYWKEHQCVPNII